jgi:hypothetical protein
MFLEWGQGSGIYRVTEVGWREMWVTGDAGGRGRKKENTKQTNKNKLRGP